MMSPTTRNRSPARGFTLIELCVVLVIISLVLAIAIPHYGGFLTRGTMRSEARRIAALARYLISEASRSGNVYYLNFDVAKGRYWVTVGGGRGRPMEERTQLTKVRVLPGGIAFKDVAIAGRAGKSQGRNTIAFYPRGESDEAIVHFSDYGGKQFCSLHIKPYNGRSVTYDYYFKGYKEVYHKRMF
jgi:prepilin-type N-terminal cleavage/methylation domain-containing protein